MADFQVGCGMTGEIETLIAETRRLCAEATPGELEPDDLGDISTDDFQLYAFARTALERLCDEVERLREELGMASASGCKSPCVDAIDKCFELVDGKPEWDYPGQVVHIVMALMRERDEALGKVEGAEQLPRVWVGDDEPRMHAGYFQWMGLIGWVRISGGEELKRGTVFLPSSSKPTIDPRTMKSIATCSEVDW